jgi:Icc-related predicted phosphoesterase
MRLHIMSDLHLHSAPMAALPLCGDVLILAGDVTDGIRSYLKPLVIEYLEAGLPVLYVPGNHEFDCTHMAQELRELAKLCRSIGVTLLHNRAVTVRGMRFVGTTLWTDFELQGKPAVSMHMANASISDFSVIRKAGRKLTPADTVKAHQKARRFLEREFATAFSGARVLITHHGLNEESISPYFRGSSLNAAYVSDLTLEVMRWNPLLAIHGHVHRRVDYTLGGTRVIANPRGRVKLIEDTRTGEMLEQLEHDGFDVQFTIDI